MDCCKKEEDCCPCADRIKCLQAQIDELKASTVSLDVAAIIGFVAGGDIKTLNKFKRFQNMTYEKNGQPGPNKLK